MRVICYKKPFDAFDRPPVYDFKMGISENDWNKCYIKVNGKFIEVIEGSVINPETKKEEKLNFFYLSSSNKMVLMDFDDALIEIKESLKHHKCRPKLLDKRRHRDEYKQKYSMLCKKLENLEEAIGNVNKHQCCHPEGGGRDQLNESRKLNQCALSQRDLSSRNSLSEESVNRTYLIELDETVDKVKKQVEIGDIPSATTAGLRSRRTASEASFYISADDLRIIGKWASKNRDFIRYKGMDSVPEGTFENDDDYFFQLIFAINPTVVLDKNLPKLRKKMKSSVSKSPLKTNYCDSENGVESRESVLSSPREFSAESDEQNAMSQSEFAEQLGLIHSDMLSKHLSQSSSRKSRTLRNLSKTCEFHTSALDRIRDKRRRENKLFTDEINKENLVKRNNVSNEPFTIIDNWTFTPKQKQPFEVETSREKKQDPFKAFYTTEEDRCIINWVTQGSNYTKVKGNAIWRDLENLHIMPGGDRSWQSLRTRFLKYILPQLCDYGLKKEDIFKIVKGANDADKRNKQLAKNLGKISPSRITIRERPKLAEKRKHHPDVQDVYLQSDELEDNTLELSFANYRTKLRRSCGVGGKKPERSEKPESGSEPDQISTRLRTRKLFTETTFVQSMSEKLSMIVQ